MTALAHPKIVPAGPRTLKYKDRRGRWTEERAVGFVSQPYIILYTDLGQRNVDPRIVYLI